MFKLENRWKLQLIGIVVMVIIIIILLITDDPPRKNITYGCPHCEEKYNDVEYPPYIFPDDLPIQSL